MSDAGSLPSVSPILLLGGAGQLGLALCKELGKEGLSLPGRTEVDLLQPGQLAYWVEQLRPRVIINAAAYTLVDQAETEPELAYKMNAQAVVALSEAAKRVGALLVHFSTDYVFDGYGDSPWREEDKPAPLNVYGLSKWQGEQAILASGCRHLILRTSWLHSPYRHNFLKTMLRLGQERASLSVVCDQIGAPTSAALLAKVTLGAIEQTLANPVLCGLYHVTACGQVSWFDYASFIFAEAQRLGLELKVRETKPVLSCVYPTAARRPLNSRLDTSKLRTTFGLELPHWSEGVEETLRQLLKEK
ncbi:dTDP-4-dehydrorhamnose reductase [Aeromonas sp. Prich7-2]|uniref:dTDP-4-dehydrorhamnose reductase n=1 Tax=Aeromonas sp. Prich7-2 TaxID=2823361 RepID=UPI001B32C61C|nr:dTDP-4-dehydrorhamnose reductase [Aeromonas sp. Prich7-2]MBP4060895.1 dTDP-4-dehydrorhamnose reductase [Aeromonas sp. Prich7-2]